MLKTCFLPINYTNFTNKTCGEIICQTETTFTIICKLCDIKLFEYEEFIGHFRSVHWSEICSKFNHNASKNYQHIKSENRIEEQNIKVEKQTSPNLVIDKPNEDTFSNVDEESDTDHSKKAIEDDFDTEDSTQPLAILKKVSILVCIIKHSILKKNLLTSKGISFVYWILTLLLLCIILFISSIQEPTSTCNSY